MNQWSMVRGEERAIYTQGQIQPFRSKSKVSTQITKTFGPTQKHCSCRQSTRLARISPELPTIAGTSGSRDFRLPSGLPTDMTSQATKSQGVGTFGGSRDFRRAKMRRRLSREVLGLLEGAGGSSTLNSRLPSGLPKGEDA